MTDLKGVYELDTIINEFLKPFGCEARLSDDFGYYEGEKLITYALVIPANHFDDFMDSVERLRPNIEADVFLWALLHELGHHETLPLMSKKLRKKSDKKRAKVDNDEIDGLEYYKLPDEKAATRWAVEFADSNPDLLADFWEKCQAAIQQFYKVNNVEDI